MPRSAIGEVHVLVMIVPSSSHISSRIALSTSTKHLTGILVETVLNLYINLGGTDSFAMLSLLIHEHGVTLLLFKSLLH